MRLWAEHSPIWSGWGAVSGPALAALPWQRPPVHNHPGAREQLGASSREVVDVLGQLVNWSCKWSSSPWPSCFKQSVGGGYFGDGHRGFSVYSVLTPSVSPSEVKFSRLFFFSQNQSFPFQRCPQSQCFLLNLGITRIRHFQALCQTHFRWKPIISNPYDLFSVQNSIQSLWDLTFSDDNVTLCNS